MQRIAAARGTAGKAARNVQPDCAVDAPSIAQRVEILDEPSPGRAEAFICADDARAYGAEQRQILPLPMGMRSRDGVPCAALGFRPARAG